MRSGSSIRTGAAGLGVALLCLLPFWGALEGGFVHLDDNVHIFENQALQQGLSFEGVRWALTTGYAANWHPVTWISFLADYEWHGLDPAGYHLTNLIFHALNGLWLFVVLRRMTGRFGLSLLVAALWGVHPLRVESVVWISERKDVLAMFFGLLALLAYGSGKGRRSWKQQVGMAACFALSLMSKPMGVTLPFLLLLLDVWPLRRWPEEGAWALIREKIPLFLLSAVSCVITYFVQQAGNAVIPAAMAPLTVRLTNSWVATVEYIRLLFWPLHLAAFYPHLGVDMPSARIWGSLAILVVLTAAAIWTARRRPWFLMGWLWFLGSLVPMIGLVQVGAQAWADRYTYLPHIGLWVALVWGAAEAVEAVRWRRLVAIGLSAGLIVVLSILSRRQTQVWHDSETLFRSTLANTKNNSRIHMNLGAWYSLEGRHEEALEPLLWSLAIQPRRNEARYNLGNWYREDGKKEEAIRQYRVAIEENPRHFLALNNLARMLVLDPDVDRATAEEAVELAQAAVENGRKAGVDFQDTLALAHWRLGKCWMSVGRPADAEEQFRQSLVSKPQGNRAAYDLATLHLEMGRNEEAAREYRDVIAGNPGHADALNNLSWLLVSDPAAGADQTAEALALARRALESAEIPTAAQLDTLALALAANGDASAAAETAEKAVERARSQGDEALADDIGRRLATYRAGEKEQRAITN